LNNNIGSDDRRTNATKLQTKKDNDDDEVRVSLVGSKEGRRKERRKDEKNKRSKT